MSDNVYVVVDRGEGISTPTEQPEFYVAVNYGPQGVTGYVGSQGVAGFTGSTGYTGSIGYVGSQGVTGYVGSQGALGYSGSMGYSGSTGYVGSQGVTGYVGSQGVAGFTGSTGYTGSQGYSGSSGYVGSAGATGYSGSIGFTGSAGYVGSQGITGYSGSVGYVGSQGVQGYSGSVGYVGSQGTTGYVGSQGIIGYSGSQGYTGSVGPGVATGGIAGDLLFKVDGTDYNTVWTTPTYAQKGTNSDITSMTGMTGGLSTPDYVDFDVTATPTAAIGRVMWDAGNGTLQVRLAGGNVDLQIGQEEVVRVFNNTASPMVDGQIVYVTGAQGNRPAVGLASASSEAGSSVTIGMVTEPIASGAEGFITTSGMVHGLDTSALAEGVALWLGITPGTYTTTRPTAPNHAVLVGYVVRSHLAAGSIYVKVQNGFELDELHNVSINAPTTQQVLGYNGSVWANHSLTTSDVQSGTFSADRLGAGTPDATKFLRGDSTWSVPTAGQGGLGNILCWDVDGTQDDVQIAAYDTLNTLTVNTELNIGKTFDIKFVGGTYGWRDLFGGMEPRSGSSGPTWTQFRDGIYLYAFPSNLSREVFACYHIDHDYAQGTVLYPHVHFSVNTTSTGTVRWGFEYTVAKGHQQLVGSTYAATTIVYVDMPVNGATDQYKHFVAEVDTASAIQASLVEPDTVILMRVFRDTAHVNDTYPDNVFGIQVDLHYQTAHWATPNRAPNFYN